MEKISERLTEPPCTDEITFEEVSSKFFEDVGKPLDEPEVDFSRLDIRVGKILDARCHPCAPDLLYLHLIDIGEDWERPVGGQLIHHYKLSDLIDRKVVLLKNSATTWCRGYDSQGTLLGAKMGDRLELLNPPPEAEPGDRVIVPGFKPAPDLPFMDPEKNIFETVVQFCKVDYRKQATYGDISWKVDGKDGFITTDSFAEVPVVAVDCYENICR